MDKEYIDEVSDLAISYIDYIISETEDYNYASIDIDSGLTDNFVLTAHADFLVTRHYDDRDFYSPPYDKITVSDMDFSISYFAYLDEDGYEYPISDKDVKYLYNSVLININNAFKII